MIVVTASGGGWKDAYTAMAALTCRNFTNPSAAMNTAVTLSITIIRFAMGSFSLPVRRIEGSEIDTRDCGPQAGGRRPCFGATSGRSAGNSGMPWANVNGKADATLPLHGRGSPSRDTAISYRA